MEIRKSWEIPFKKNQIGFCFIYDYFLYLGFNNGHNYISIGYDLIEGCIRTIPEIVLPSTGINSINYFAKPEILIIGENGKIRTVYGTTK